MSTLRRPSLSKKRISWNDMAFSSGSSSMKIRLTRRIVQLQQDKTAARVLEQAKQLCTDFVDGKLEREGLRRPSRRSWTTSNIDELDEKWPTISKRTQEVGWMLEECYPRLYSNISNQVNAPFTSEEVVHDVFSSVCKEIVKDGVNWARVVALYTFAGALATECHKDSRSVYVGEISNWMYEFAAMYLVDWIKRKGGWGDLLRAFPRSSVADYLITSRGRWRVLDYVTNWITYVITNIRESSRSYMRKLSLTSSDETKHLKTA